jgi:hypothetical protein
VKPREILLALVDRKRDDFTSYFVGTSNAEAVAKLVDAVLSDPKKATAERQRIEVLIPNTEDDGSLEASYALNAGVIVTLFADFALTGSETCVEDAKTLFLDSADFRAQEALRVSGVHEPTEDQIREHPIFVRERQWLDGVVGEPGA